MVVVSEKREEKAMDYNNVNGNGEHWGWQGEDYCFQKDPSSDVSQRLWNEVALNGEDLSYMLDETTPVKACGDLAYHVNHDNNMNKEPEEQRETCSQFKRRRLQFDTHVEDSPFCDEDLTSVFLKSNETEESLEEVFPRAPQWDSGYQDMSASCYNGLDQSSEHWIAGCFNDSEMHFSPNDMSFPGASDIQIDISDFCNDPPEFEASMVQKRVTRTPRNVVFKGTKSFIQTPTKLATSVAYPFAFIKPCGVHGDVTLNEINQRIRTPPPSKSKQKDEDPVVYPMSAFSGKPVVGKTKIRTEGGKGSITIMRTKG
ncbi:INDUCED TRANSCRIPT PROTEIN putative-RELATED [Salix viminalis]|uniref:INDUCED TRANSCRIPT PROTEIN putative-RELATED n=1 Tax=Salix viminalis TaxID=40686 RepID=A0A6N2MYB5_SALVM|nr:INDUCED TRANSCRIPT PROTEIN putative-RELATED [Salix viminalis]